MPIAVDTNFLIAPAEKDETALDALGVLFQRGAHLRKLVPPTVVIETRFLSCQTEAPRLQHAAMAALRSISPEWRMEFGSLSSAQYVIAERIAREILGREILPGQERHDALILAEAAQLEAILLVTDDSMIRGADRLGLELIFSSFDLHAPVIATPREIIRHFYR